MRNSRAMFFTSDVYSAVSDLMAQSDGHDEEEFIEAAIHKLERELADIRKKREGGGDE